MKTAIVFPRLKEQVHGMWPPLGAITLGTILRDSGHDVHCLDASFDPSLERVLEELRRIKPDLVGVSCLTDFYANAREVVREAKSLPAYTVMGGPHPTIAPEQTMADLPELDYAVTGEAEKSFPALIKALSDGEDVSGIPGIVFRQDGAAVFSGPAEPVEDLDSIPVPDRELLDVNDQYLRARAINLHATRGCPYRCRFCQPTLEKMFGKKVRYQSPQRVAEEIEHFHKRYGLFDFFFHDDTFTISGKWMEGIRKALSEKGLIQGFRYVVNSRVDTFSEDKARTLKEMGVYYVLFGIESGSQKILDSIGKGTTVEQAREAFRICKRFGFRTHAYVLLGAPEETQETLQETEKLVAELRPSTVHISIFTPLLGTELYDECAREGRIQVDNYSEMDYYLKKTSSGEPPIKIPGLSYQDLLDSRARILSKRRPRVFLDNFKELLRDLVREPSLDKLIFRYQFYKRMQHYFG
ncbi:MAG: radical SAM protein [bacterium]